VAALAEASMIAYSRPMRLPLLALLALFASTSAFADDALWSAIHKGGYALVMRHAQAPGKGDPANFRLDDCTTQRNLSAEGRGQAAELGKAIRERNVPVGRVLSSRWCRALETARLAFGQVEPEPALDQFYEADQRIERSGAVRAIIHAWSKDRGNLVLVTHQPNVTALTNLEIEEGEIVVMAVAPDGTLAVYGRLKPSPAGG
jgi:phosphohistidine phosphatase SixA